VHLGRGAGVQTQHLASLRAALFETTDLQITPVERFSDEELDWASPEALTSAPPEWPSPGWRWHRPDRVVSAPTWGGNLEIMSWNLAADRWIRPSADYSGCVLLLETSEEMPPAEEVFRMLRNAGERGLLEQFPAVVVATAKASNIGHRPPQDERQKFRDEQQAAVVRALEMYNPAAMAVFGVDFGHTSPQWVLPYGGRITVDGPARTITAHF